MTRFLTAFLIFAFLIAFAGITSGSSPGDSQNQVLGEDSKDRMPRPWPRPDQKCSKICRRYECCEWTYGPYDRPICKKECCAEYVERCE
jgi:hypothetical protein